MKPAVLTVFVAITLLTSKCQAQHSVEDCARNVEKAKQCVQNCVDAAGCGIDAATTTSQGSEDYDGKKDNIRACFDACKPANSEKPRKPPKQCFADATFRSCFDGCVKTPEAFVQKQTCKRLMCECIASKVAEGVCPGPAKDCNKYAPRNDL